MCYNVGKCVYLYFWYCFPVARLSCKATLTVSSKQPLIVKMNGRGSWQIIIGLWLFGLIGCVGLVFSCQPTMKIFLSCFGFRFFCYWSTYVDVPFVVWWGQEIFKYLYYLRWYLWWSFFSCFPLTFSRIKWEMSLAIVPNEIASEIILQYV